MLKRDKLLDILKTRFDYYAAQAVFNDVVSALDLRDVETLDAETVEKVCAFLAKKVPGTKELIERLSAPVAAPVAVVAEPAPEPAPEPAAEEAAEPAVEDAPADDGGKKKKKK